MGSQGTIGAEKEGIQMEFHPFSIQILIESKLSVYFDLILIDAEGILANTRGINFFEGHVVKTQKRSKEVMIGLHL